MKRPAACSHTSVVIAWWRRRQTSGGSVLPVGSSSRRRFKRGRTRARREGLASAIALVLGALALALRNLTRGSGEQVVERQGRARPGQLVRRGAGHAADAHVTERLD